ncbi:MAG: hypothetical protein ACXVBO_20855 [Isosphaeraceae bacterium]
MPPPEPGTTWRPRAMVGTSSRSPGRRARLAVLQPDEGVLVVVALDDPVDAQRAQGRALQLRIAQGPREVGGRCHHATGQHGKIQGAKEWGVSLSIYLDGAHGRYLWRESNRPGGCDQLGSLGASLPGLEKCEAAWLSRSRRRLARGA